MTRRLLATVILTRIIVFTLKVLLDPATPLAQRIFTDPYHHYHLGLLLVLASLFSSPLKFKWLFPIGLGIVLEELPVVLADLGAPTLTLYHTGFDFAVIIGAICLTSLVSSRIKPSHPSLAIKIRQKQQ